MYKQIQMALAVAALLYGVGSTALAKTNGTSAAAKMSNKQMMDKMNSMPTAERAAMFDKMTMNDQMTAMKMAGHDMGKMSHKDRMDALGKLPTQQKADMFDKMPMDTRMATMRKAMKESKAGKTNSATQ